MGIKTYIHIHQAVVMTGTADFVGHVFELGVGLEVNERLAKSVDRHRPKLASHREQVDVHVNALNVFLSDERGELVGLTIKGKPNSASIRLKSRFDFGPINRVDGTGKSLAKQN